MLKDTHYLLDDYGFADFLALEAFLMMIELWAHHDKVFRRLKAPFSTPSSISRPSLAILFFTLR
jgi:hypothetical protein